MQLPRVQLGKGLKFKQEGHVTTHEHYCHHTANCTTIAELVRRQHEKVQQPINVAEPVHLRLIIVANEMFPAFETQIRAFQVLYDTSQVYKTCDRVATQEKPRDKDGQHSQRDVFSFPANCTDRGSVHDHGFAPLHA